MNKRLIYLIIFILAISVSSWSIIYLSSVAKKTDTPLARSFPAPTTSDAEDYDWIARNLVNHGQFSISKELPLEPDTFRTPAYPLFIALFYKLFGTLYAVLVAQALIVFLTAILIFKMAEKIIGDKWALIPTIIYIFDPNTMFGASTIFTENLFVPLFISSIYILFFSEIKNRYKKGLFAGILLALTALVRPIALYLPVIIIPSYFLFYWVKSDWVIRRKQIIAMIIFLVAFSATVFPWFLRNKEVSGVWGFASVGTFGLFRENVPRFLATINDGNTGEIRQEILARADLPPGKVSRRLQDSSIMQKVFLEVVMANPVRYAIYHIGSLPSFFLNSGVHHYLQFIKHQIIEDFTGGSEPGLAQALVTFSWPTFVIVIKNHGFFLIENVLLALITLLFFVGAWRSKNVGISRLFVVIVLYFALITGPISHARYRMPVTPLILIGAASTALYLWQRKEFFKQKRIQ
jgi:hypothetical protein